MNNGIGKLGFGGAGLTSMSSSGKVFDLLQVAFDAGIRHFDTAPLYGQGYSERLIGNFIKKRRSEITVTTKFGLGLFTRGFLPESLALPLNYYKKKLRGRAVPSALPVAPESPVNPDLPFRRITLAEVRNSLEESLRSLRTDRIDYYFLHEGLPSFLNPDAFEFLLRAKERSVVGKIGIATHSRYLAKLDNDKTGDWDILQYEAPPLTPGKHMQEIFPGKAHFLHSCIKDLQNAKSPGDVSKEELAGYLLAQCAGHYGVDKVLFSTRRINTLRLNLASFGKYYQTIS